MEERSGRRPTMADVAKRVGVSRALVSLVFRNQPGAGEETRRRVLRAADELGYRPDSAARLLARGRSRTIGVVLTVHQTFQADLVEGIYPEAERLGYDVLLSASAPGRDENKAVEALLSHRCEALLLLGPKAPNARIEELGRRSAVVVVGRRARGAEVDSVHTSESRGVSQVVSHLAELGHRHIVHIDGGKDPGAAERRRAFRAAMRAHGLAGSARVLPGAHTEESGSAAGRLLLAGDRLPTAVFASNDRCAMGLMHTLDRAGVHVPREVSVVGYDDSHLSHLSHIDLSTVRQDPVRLAEHAVRFAVERLADATLPPREAVLEPRLVVRGTSAAPPARAD